MTCKTRERSAGSWKSTTLTRFTTQRRATSSDTSHPEHRLRFTNDFKHIFGRVSGNGQVLVNDDRREIVFLMQSRAGSCRFEGIIQNGGVDLQSCCLRHSASCQRLSDFWYDVECVWQRIFILEDQVYQGNRICCRKAKQRTSPLSLFTSISTLR